MQYIDIATKDMILFAFLMIVLIFVMTFVLETIANFFRIIFRIGKNKNDDK